MSNTVLAVIELDRFPEQVAARAAWIARLYDCKLHLLLSDPTLGILRDNFIVSNEAKQIAADIRSGQRQILDDVLASIAGGDELETSSSVSHNRPASDAIIATAIDLDPEFVVKGTHFHSRAERAMFADVDWQLVRELEYPLWLVRPGGWRDQPVIIAAVDPTHAHDKSGRLDRDIVATGKVLADRSGGRLMLLHTYQRLTEIGNYARFRFKPVKVPVAQLDADLRARHGQLLDDLATANDISAADVQLMPGRASDLLPAFARQNAANLVIMGALCRGGLKRRALGSTAEQVLDHLHCDILIARGE